MRCIGMVLGALALVAMGPGVARADCNAYFKDQRFTLVVPFGAGGGYDAYARAFAPVFEDITAANVQVANITGGGGIIGAGRVANAHADDRVFGFFSSSRANAYHTEVPDSPGLVPLAGVQLEYEVWIAAAGTNLEDLLETGIVSGGSSFYTGVTDTAFAAMALGADVSLVSGYDGSAESSAAILRGEVDLAGRTASSALKAKATGEFDILLTLTDEPVDGLGVPALGNLAAARAVGLSPEERAERMKFAALAPKLTQNLRAFWASSQLAPEALACLVEGVSDAVASAAYLEAAAAIGRPVTSIAQHDAVAFFQATSAAFEESEPLIEALRDTLK
ncbi:MAG: hypothetical protein AAGM21_07295 [Pseudomonadota bacterium]